eukprot:2283043-Rhodomonas_salina.1
MSSSSALCKTATSGFRMNSSDIVLTMQTNVQHTFFDSFSFDRPSVTAVLLGNGPTASSALMTVFGRNFGGSDFSAKQQLRLGFTSCEATAWLSDDQLVCTAAGGVSDAHTVSVTSGVDVPSGNISARLDALSLAFSFDAPRLSSLAPSNLNHAGGASVS